MSAQSSSALATSARSATLLVLLQISSRAFTFIVNQILLRYLSPELLGISQQLELYTISVLYFSRESLRVALQRQGDKDSDTLASSTSIIKKDKNENDRTTEPAVTAANARAQSLVNLTYLPILLGPILATLFSRIYLAKASPSVLAVPFLKPSLEWYSFFAVIELTVEPCFAIAAQQQLIRLRAGAETAATLARCIMTVSVAVLGSKYDVEFGALPFALGQGAYACTLWVVYYGWIFHSELNTGFSLFPRPVGDRTTHVLRLFPRPVLSLAANLYAQSGLKHILTQGDSLLITLFASLADQGVYALAANYGSLLARVLFQPIEESSRGFFGRTLSPTPTSPDSQPNSTTDTPEKPQHSQPSSSAGPKPAALTSAHTYLTHLLRTYSLLSLYLLTLAPYLAPPLLRLTAGRAWSSSAAPQILSLYCYYLPLLAYNGILEAFVAAVATPAQLRTQSAAMLGFSAAFGGAGWLLLGVWGWGAMGLVGANAVNMLVRIAWCSVWVGRWWAEKRVQATNESARDNGSNSNEKAPLDTAVPETQVPELHIFSANTLPKPLTLSLGVVVWAALRQTSQRGGGGWVGGGMGGGGSGGGISGYSSPWQELASVIALAAPFGLVSLWLERATLMELWEAVAPARAKKRGVTGGVGKEVEKGKEEVVEKEKKEL